MVTSTSIIDAVWCALCYCVGPRFQDGSLPGKASDVGMTYTWCAVVSCPPDSTGNDCTAASGNWSVGDVTPEATGGTTHNSAESIDSHTASDVTPEATGDVTSVDRAAVDTKRRKIQNARLYSKVQKAVESKPEAADQLLLDNQRGVPQSSASSPPKYNVVFGSIVSLQAVTSLTSEALWSMFEESVKLLSFRDFAGRAILDLKVKGDAMIVLDEPYNILAPLVSAIIDVAKLSLDDNEELAILQLIINLYHNGGNAVRRHQHRCRQICASLGYDRDVIVENSRMTMRCGDILPLNREFHEVPAAEHSTGPRISVCLFYGSVDEYARQTISVNASDGHFGSSYWWIHPKDIAVQRLPGTEPAKSSAKTSSCSKRQARGKGHDMQNFAKGPCIANNLGKDAGNGGGQSVMVKARECSYSDSMRFDEKAEWQTNAFDGTWRDDCGVVGTIAGSTLHWAHPVDGVAMTKLRFFWQSYSLCLVMEVFGEALVGVLHEDATRIDWSNGDRWFQQLGWSSDYYWRGTAVEEPYIWCPPASSGMLLPHGIASSPTAEGSYGFSSYSYAPPLWDVS